MARLRGQTGKGVGVPQVSGAGSLCKVTWKLRLHFHSGQWPVVTALTLTAPLLGSRFSVYLRGGDRGGPLALHLPPILGDRRQGQPFRLRFPVKPLP